MFSKGCEKLNSQERTLAERVYGQGTFFAANMKMLHEANINNTRIFVLNPEYVRSQAAEGPIGRASWLRDFYNVSNFGADGRNINLHYRLRGVVVGEARSAAAPKNVVPLLQLLHRKEFQDHFLNRF